MTTTTTTTPMSVTRRLLSISAAPTIAAVGLVALSAPAYAADADSQVWVCRYVRTPGGDEVLKEGKTDPGRRPLRRRGQGRHDRGR